MSNLHMRHSHLIIDACSLINLQASQYLPSMLRTLPVPVVVSQAVRLEIGSFDLQFQPYLDQGILQVCDFDDMEHHSFIRLLSTVALGDGEAATIVMAANRSWAIMSDDQAVSRYLQRQQLPIQCISTPELVCHWGMTDGVSGNHIRSALYGIEQYGRFKPVPPHPWAAWWERMIGRV